MKTNTPLRPEPEFVTDPNHWRLLDLVEDLELDLHLLVGDEHCMPGARASIQICGWRHELKRGQRTWQVTSISPTLPGEPSQSVLVLTPAQDAAAVAALRQKYRVIV